MTEQERNDYFYVCALIEYIARETKNHRGDIVKAIGEEGIKKLLYDAEVNHCLSFEQVSDEVISYYQIKQGTFDTISDCKYSIPSYLDIGRLYSIMIEDCAETGAEVQELIKIFSSFISDKISDFKTAVSEAVTNAIIHAYPKTGGDIEAYFKREDKKITVLITDYGIGIKDVGKSMQPLYSTLHTQERSGMGFTFMEAFADEVKVKSVPGKGTTVKLIKIIGKGEECGENL